MAVTNYIRLGSTIIGERIVGGSRRNYAVDGLGSVTATINGSVVENTYAYSPYGSVVQKTGTAPDPAFQWVGTRGYQQTGRNYAEVYIRARTYSTKSSRWLTRDSLWPDQSAYGYAGGRVLTAIDPSGQCVWVCTPCLACLLDFVGVCGDQTGKDWGFWDCVKGVWDNLASWAKWACGIACGACLTCIAKGTLNKAAGLIADDAEAGAAGEGGGEMEATAATEVMAETGVEEMEATAAVAMMTPALKQWQKCYRDVSQPQ